MSSTASWRRRRDNPPGGSPSGELRKFVFGPAALAEVVDIKRLDELLEHRQLFLVNLGRLFGLDFTFGFFVFEDQASLLEDGFFDIDRYLRPNRQRDCMGRTRVDLDVATVRIHDQLGENSLGS